MLFSPGTQRRRLQLRISERRLLLMAGDTLSVAIAVFVALFIWSQVADESFTIDFILPQSYLFFVLMFLWLLLAGANDFYALSLASRRGASLVRLVIITSQMLVIYFLIFFLSPRDALPRLFIIYYAGVSFSLIGLWRVANPALIGWASDARRVLIVGSDEAAKTIIAALNEYGRDAYEIHGIIGEESQISQVIDGIPVIGSGSDLLNFVFRDDIKEIVFTYTPDLSGDIFRSLMQSYERGVVLTPMPLLYERLTGRVPVEHVKRDWALVLPIEGNTLFDVYPILSWLINTLLALIGFIVFLVLLPIIALVIRLDSKGGVFYTQHRVGLNGRDFQIIKFRTMVKNAEGKTGAVFSQKNDSRITRIGRFMRKTRLDELPQVINILRGDMSLIGPRPERPEHVTRFTEKIPFYRTRLVVRPGLTGWAQVKYNYGANDHDALVKLEYDLYYIRHQSLLLDFSIIIRTIGRVIRMSGV